MEGEYGIRIAPVQWSSSLLTCRLGSWSSIDFVFNLIRNDRKARQGYENYAKNTITVKVTPGKFPLPAQMNQIITL